MSEPSPVEKALDVVVYAPLGVALFARDTVPSIVGMFVARGRSEVSQRRRAVSRGVTQARTIGRFAVRYGGPEVRRRVEDGVATARAHAETTIASIAVGRDDAAPPASTAAAETTGRAEHAAPSTNGHRPEGSAGPAQNTAPPVAALPIPDYDGLSASQVVERLDGLAGHDLATVRAYESAHRGRRTILGKIAQLDR